MSQCVLVDCTGVSASANPPGTLFMNDRVLVGCANGSVLYQCTAPARYPAGITFDTGASKAAVAAGTFGSSTLANANALATIYGTDFIAGEILAGRMFCGSACPSLVILKDDEVTNVLNQFCENIQTINGAIYFMPWGGASGAIYSSTNALNWTRVLTPAAGKFAYDLAYGAGLYVAPGNSVGGNGAVYTSPDAVNWTQRTAIAGFASTLWAAAYGAGVFVVGGDVNTVAWSADGITWNNLGSIGTGGSNIYRIRFLNGVFYALNAFTGKMFSSADGKVWVLAHTFTTPQDIAYGNGLYALCENGNIWTSPNAVTWTQHVFAGAPHLTGLAFGNGLFTLVTGTKKVLTSPDAVTWTDSGRTASVGLAAVTYAGNGKFVAAEG